jgi:hypothetical protein
MAIYLHISHAASSSVECDIERDEEAPATVDMPKKSESYEQIVGDNAKQNENDINVGTQEPTERNAAPADRQCKVEGCLKYRKRGCKQMCQRHYNEWKQNKNEINEGFQEPTESNAAPADRQCKVEGCLKYRKGGCKQMCQRHYNKWKLNHGEDDDEGPSKKRQKLDLGDCGYEIFITIPPASQPMIPSENLDTEAVEHTKNASGHKAEDEGQEDKKSSSSEIYCSVGGCPRFIVKQCNQMCLQHFNLCPSRGNEAPEKYNDTKHSQKRSSSSHRKCIAEGCNKDCLGIHTNGMCSRHYKEWCKQEENSASDRGSSNEVHLHQPIIRTSKPNGSRSSSASIGSTNQTSSSQSIQSSESSRSSSSRRTCEYLGCQKYSRGKSTNYMCQRHFKESSISGEDSYEDDTNSVRSSVSSISANSSKICIVPECQKYRRGKSTNYMCAKHYKQLKLRESNADAGFETDEPSYREMRQCRIPGCEKYFVGRHSSYMCRFHFLDCKQSSSSSDSISDLSDLSDDDDSSQDEESTVVQCTIFGCEEEAIVSEDVVLCEDHLLLYGTNPPKELIRTEDDGSASTDYTKLCDEYEKLYDILCFYMADESSHGRRKAKDHCYWFDKVRKELIRRAKRKQNVRIIEKRLEREVRVETEVPALSLENLLNGEPVIPASKAKRIMHNIMQRGIQNIGNINDAVLGEAKLVLQLDEENEEVMQDPIYEHLPICEVDDLVGWATSHRGNDDNAWLPNSMLRAEVPPPMPSQIAFLRQVLENKLLDRMKQLHPNETVDRSSERAHNVINRIDQSALVALGISLEEALISAMIPLATAHAKQQSWINHRQKECSGNGQTPVNLPITEAIAKLASDKSVQNKLLLNILDVSKKTKSRTAEDTMIDTTT